MPKTPVFDHFECSRVHDSLLVHCQMESSGCIPLETWLLDTELICFVILLMLWFCTFSFFSSCSSPSSPSVWMRLSSLLLLLLGHEQIECSSLWQIHLLWEVFPRDTRRWGRFDGWSHSACHVSIIFTLYFRTHFYWEIFGVFLCILHFGCPGLLGECSYCV